MNVAVPWNTSINGFTVPLPFLPLYAKQLRLLRDLILDSYYVNWTFSKNWRCGEIDCDL